MGCTVSNSESYLSDDDALSPKETGDGDLSVYVVNSLLRWTKDNGINAKGSGGGDATLNIHTDNVTTPMVIDMSEPGAQDDGNDGVYFHEQGDGDLTFGMYSSLVEGSDDIGVNILEFGDGNLGFTLDDAEIWDSNDGAFSMLPAGEGRAYQCDIINSDLDSQGYIQRFWWFAPLQGESNLTVVNSTIGTLTMQATSRLDEHGDVIVDNVLDITNSLATWIVSPEPSFAVFVDGEEQDLN